MFGAFPLDLRGIEDNALYTLAVPQRRIEAMLRERAAELGVVVRPGCEVVDLEQGDDRVRLVLATGETVDAEYVVGADGGRSTVRKRAGIGFPGATEDHTITRSGHVTVPDEMVTEGGGLSVPGYGLIPPLRHTRTPYGMIVWGRLPGGPPMLSTMEWGQPGSGENSIEELSASVTRVLGGARVPMVRSEPGLLRRLEGQNTRLAQTYQRGRVLLLGDAAHVHSAMGGPGLNLGLQDAVNLGWKLAATVNGTAPRGLLATYQKERRPVAERVTMHTRAQAALVRPGGETTALRELFGELMDLPGTRRHLVALLAGTDVSYDMGQSDKSPNVGKMGPNYPMPDAQPIIINAQPPEGWHHRVTTVTIPHTPPMFLRPDGYVAWEEGAGDLSEALSRWLGH